MILSYIFLFVVIFRAKKPKKTRLLSCLITPIEKMLKSKKPTSETTERATAHNRNDEENNF